MTGAERLAIALSALRDIAGMSEGVAELDAAPTAVKALEDLGELWEYNHQEHHYQRVPDTETTK